MTPKKMTNLQWLLAISLPLLILAALVWYNLGVYQQWKEHQDTQANGIEVQGTVTKRDKIHTHRSKTFYLWYSYVAELPQGGTKTFNGKAEVDEESYNLWKEGSRLRIFYQKDQPQISARPGNLGIDRTIIYTILLDLFVIIGGIVAWRKYG